MTINSVPPASPATSNQHPVESAYRWLHFQSLLVVFFGGLNLVLIQWVLVRELTTLLFGTELVILLVTVSYFAGISVGYALSGWIKRRWLLPFGILTLILHLTLPIWFRLLVVFFDASGAYALTFIVLPLSVPFIISAFYSIFLPLYADDDADALPALYALEVLGTGCGVLILVALGGVGLQAVYVMYGVSLLLILTALNTPKYVLAGLGLMVAGWLILLPALNAWSNTAFFSQLYGLPDGTTTLYTGYSAYQKVDVLETPDGTRFLFLDGLEHFGSSGGSWLNIVMGRIPASLMFPQNALVFGAGSMQLELMIANYADWVTTVELDPAVVDASTTYLTAYNRMDELENRTVIIDDAKHFIANDDARYDLIATDLPAAFTIQTATLYSQAFFEEVSEHLETGGVFSVNLTDEFTPDSEISRRIAAGLLATFDEVMVVTSSSAGWSFAYASDDLPFTRDQVAVAIEAGGETNYAIFETDAVRAIAGNVQPITLDTLDTVLSTSLSRIRSNLE